MTTYTFVGNTSTSSVKWTDPTIWSPDIVPDSPTAVVVIPTIFFTNQPGHVVDAFTITQSSPIEIDQLSISAENTLDLGSSFTVDGDLDVETGGVVNADSGLAIGGSLTVGGTFGQGTPTLAMAGEVIVQSGGLAGLSGMSSTSSFTAGSFDNSGTIDGYEGSIVSTGAFTNEAGGVVSADSEMLNLTVSAPTFDNLGELFASFGTLTIQTPSGGFAQFSGGTLTGGRYFAGEFAKAAYGTLNLNIGGVVTTDAAFIELGDSGEITSYNSKLSAYQPIETTLTRIAAGGTLQLETHTTTWNTGLTVDGLLQLIEDSLTTPQLTIDPQGTFQASGQVFGPVTDNGSITGLPSSLDDTFDLLPGHQSLYFGGAVTGTGTVTAGKVEFAAAASVTVVSSAVTLDDAGGFTGALAPSVHDTVWLPNVPLDNVTSYAYVSQGNHGTLTLHMSSGPAITLNFDGNFNYGSFQLSNGETVAGATPNVLITIETSPPPHDAFLNDGVSDVLLQNASGQVDVGQVSGGSLALTDIFSDLGSQWKFVADGAFQGGDGQFLIENGAGDLGLGWVVGGKLDLESVGTVATSEKFVGAGDYLLAGTSDFLLEDTNGAVDLGQLVGGKASQTQIDTLGSQWKFVGSGDYLGTGHDQAAIENTAGSVGVGTLTSNSVDFKTVGALTSAQHIVQSGDFLGDGKADFLVDNSATGQLQVAEVVNGALTFTTIDTLGSQWSFVGAGDYLGDGHDQILIENTAGNLGIGEVLDGSVHFTTIATGLNEWMFH